MATAKKYGIPLKGEKKPTKLRLISDDDRFLNALQSLDPHTIDLYSHQLSYMIKIRIINTWRMYCRLQAKFGNDPFKWADFCKALYAGNQASARTKRLNLSAALMIKRVPPKDKFQGAFEEFVYGGGFYFIPRKSDTDAVHDLINNA